MKRCRGHIAKPMALAGRPGRARRGGFTLAELLVASTLMAIVMAGVYTAFSSALRGWHGADSNYRIYEDARLALGLLSRELQAIPPGTLHLVEGSREELEFFTLSYPMNVSDGEEARVLRVRYRLKGVKRGRGRTLIREEAIVEGALPVDPPGSEGVDMMRIRVGQRHEFVIASDVLEFSVRHYWIPRVDRAADEPPRRIEPIVEDDHRRGWGLPAGMEVALSLYDPVAASGDQGTTFTSFVVFRGRTSPLPKALDEALGVWGRS